MKSELIDYHKKKYRQAKAKIDRQRGNIEEINDIKVDLKKRRIKGFKFNHSLEDLIQSYTNYTMYLSFSSDLTTMYVTNRKPIDRTTYVLESDPREVDRLRREKYNEMAIRET